MADTAAASGRDPTDASLTAALRSARRTVITNPGFPPSCLEDARQRVARDIRSSWVPKRKPRSNPRAVKRKYGKFPVKRAPATPAPPPDWTVRLRSP